MEMICWTIIICTVVNIACSIIQRYYYKKITDNRTTCLILKDDILHSNCITRKTIESMQTNIESMQTDIGNIKSKTPHIPSQKTINETINEAINEAINEVADEQDEQDED